MPAKVMVPRTDHTPGQSTRTGLGNTGSATAATGCAPSPWSWRTVCPGPGWPPASVPGRSATGSSVTAPTAWTACGTPPGRGRRRSWKAGRPGRSGRGWMGGRTPTRAGRHAGPSPTSGRGSRTASGWGARWRARAGRCGGRASGTCPRGPSTRGRTPPPGRDSAGIPSGWRGRRCPTAWPRRMCPSTCRTGRGWGGRACCRGSGRGKGRARASCGTTGTDTCTCPPPPPACPATGDAVGHVCGRASTGETDRHLRDIGERVPAGKRALVVPGGAGRHRSKDLGIPDSVSLLQAAAHGPELNPGGTVFPLLKHRHFANRVSGSGGHVRETVERVWDAFIRRKGEVTRITTREWAVPWDQGRLSVITYLVWYKFSADRIGWCHGVKRNATGVDPECTARNSSSFKMSMESARF